MGQSTEVKHDYVIATLDNCESGSLFGRSKEPALQKIHAKKKNLHDSSVPHERARSKLQGAVGTINSALGISHALLGAAIPAIIVSPADPMYPLTARHAWQRRDGIEGLNQPKRNMTVLGGKVASTCMLYFAKSSFHPECIQHIEERGLSACNPGDQGLN
jgi:hypothetical protein